MYVFQKAYMRLIQRKFLLPEASVRMSVALWFNIAIAPGNGDVWCVLSPRALVFCLIW